MTHTVQEIEVPNQHPAERRLGLRYPNKESVRISVTNLTPGDAREEQFTYVGKDELLDALAQIGWLPDEYRKPEPLDPREAKIRAVVLVTFNDDASREPISFAKQYDTYEELVEDLGEVGVVAAYRANAEALIDAGLVKVDDE